MKPFGSLRGFGLVCVIAISVSCGGKDQGMTGPVPVASVVVTPPSATVNELDSLGFTATLKDADGNTLSGRVVTWSTNAGTKASLSASGLLHAYQPGSIAVTATSEGVSGHAIVTIVVPIAVVVLNPNSPIVISGDTVRLTASLYGPSGDPPSDSTLTWTSDDTTIATVVGGLVRGKATGAASIKATAINGKFGTTFVNVLPSVSTVTITPHGDTLLSDSTFLFSATARDSAGNPLPRTVAWSSSDTGIASVTSAGVARGRAAGTAYIRATVEGKRDSASLFVIRPSVDSVTLSLDTATLMLGARRQLTVRVVDSVGDPLHRPVQWTTSSSAVATVSDSGFVTTVGTGTDAVVASSEGVADTATLTVTQISGHITQAALGQEHGCALTDQHTVYCWGRNDYGALGTGVVTTPCGPSTSACADEPVLTAGGLAFSAVASGDVHTCGLTTGGDAYCWGSDNADQLGGAGSSQCNSQNWAGPCRFTPGLVTGGHAFRSIAAGSFFNCGLAVDSTAYCWGNNDTYQLGGDSLSTLPHATPIPVYGSHKFIAIAAGGDHVCALDAASAAWCWGGGGAGELGNDSTASSSVPVAVHGGLTFTTLVAGYGHTCGLDSSGHAYCWGANGYGMVGDGTANVATHPVTVTGGHTFTAISAAAWNTCGVETGGAAYCWGLNDLDQLGTDQLTFSLSPFLVPGSLAYGGTFNGRFMSCGLSTLGALYCWGDNYNGEAGVGFVPPTQAVVLGPSRVAGQP